MPASHPVRHRTRKHRHAAKPDAEKRAAYWREHHERGAHLQVISAFCQQGQRHAAQKNHAAAATAYLRAAEQGHTKAMQQLALCYTFGRGVAQDHCEARYWNERGIKNGDLICHNNFALQLLDDKGGAANPEKALSHLRIAAYRGYPLAQYNLARQYHKGKYIRQNLARAMRWYHKAAAQNVIPAHYWLGRLYSHRNYRDPQRAYYHLFAAAKSGHVQAQRYLGEYSYSGELWPRDYQEAAYWLEAAAQQGEARAQYQIARLYQQGIGVLVNYGRYLNYMHRAAAQGYRPAREALHLLP